MTKREHTLDEHDEWWIWPWWVWSLMNNHDLRLTWLLGEYENWWIWIGEPEGDACGEWTRIKMIVIMRGIWMEYFYTNYDFNWSQKWWAICNKWQIWYDGWVVKLIWSMNGEFDMIQWWIW